MEKSRVFLFFVLGGLGALTGWYTGVLLAPNQASIDHQIFFGALLGALISYSLAAYDGLSSGSWIRFLKFGTIGLILGIVAGAISLPMASSLYRHFAAGGATFVLGVLCWVLFGGFIGFGQTISKGIQGYKGALGGIFGGIYGGCMYEFARLQGKQMSLSGQTLLVVGIVVLGGAIGLSTALITTVLKQAWFEVMDGKFAGRNFDVTKYVDPKFRGKKHGIIGSDQLRSNVYLPADYKILPHHAEIAYLNGVPSLVVDPVAAKKSELFINGRRITDTFPLSNGDLIQIGGTRLRYHQKQR